jgi:nitroreductase/dihydropteridine reductase
MSSFISQLEWRHATKGFADNRKVDGAHLKQILHAVRMAPTSFGLQPFHVEVVTDSKLKAELLPHAWNQKQVTTCSELLIFVAHSNIADHIEKYLDGRAGGNPQIREKMKDYSNIMHAQFKDRTEVDRKAWSTKQIYIALGFAMAACAELEVDSCPMEGIDGPEFDKILKLSKEQYSVVVLAVGYRDPAITPTPKFRVPEKDLFNFRK